MHIGFRTHSILGELGPSRFALAYHLPQCLGVRGVSWEAASQPDHSDRHDCPFCLMGPSCLGRTFHTVRDMVHSGRHYGRSGWPDNEPDFTISRFHDRFALKRPRVRESRTFRCGLLVAKVRSLLDMLEFTIPKGWQHCRQRTGR